MLDYLDIKIHTCSISRFDAEAKCWYVDCWWTENDSNKNKDYATCSQVCEREGMIGIITEDGNTFSWNHNFEQAIKKDNENDWILDEIKLAQEKISTNGSVWRF